MATVRRYDAGTVSRAKKLDNGFLKAPAFLTRVGVFEYRTGDGKIRREFRPPEEVFKADALESLQLVPVTEDLAGLGQGHPREGFVDTKNARRVQVGTVSTDVRQDGDHVAATLLITDAATIARIESGKVQLSCGYSADNEETPGEWNGQRYDAIQRNIRGNHVAIVDRGRAGPSARLYLDSADGVAVGLDLSSQSQCAETVKSDSAPEGAMEKLTFDGVEIEVSEAAAKVFMAAQKKHADALTAMQTKLDAADNKCPKCGKGLKCPECSGEKKQDAADLETLKAELVKQTARADAAEKVIADAAAEKAKAEAAAAEKVRIDALVAEQVKAELAKKASEKPIVRVDSTEPVDHRAQFAAAVANACEASLAKK